MPFKALDPDLIVEQGPAGEIVRINPVASDILQSFNGKDPEQVAKLNRLFDTYTGRDPIDARRATARWLERFDISKNDPRYEAEFNRLLDAGASNRAVLAEARRAGERSELLWASDGNLDENMVYVCEGDNPCPECLELGGEEMTLAEFENAGMMPGDRCLGGDNCKCVLIPIVRL